MNAPLVNASRAAPPPVPPSAPLRMPTQDLDAPAHPARPSHRSRLTLLARWLVWGGALALSLLGLREMIGVVEADGVTPIEIVFVALFAVTFAWIALSACAAVVGTLLSGPLARAGGAERHGTARAAAGVRLHARHALVMPVYNEDPSETAAALETMARGLADAGVARHVEIFVLSDTTRADVWVAETACVDALRRRLDGTMAVWYRRRSANAGRKAGNVRDFVERWGARYEGMLVLDADSLLAAGTIVELARHLESDPTLGIVQSVPALAGGSGLFARLQQFSGSVYGPIVARGTAAWQGDDGNYWGHNAMIRVHAFAESGGLPSLPGRRPLGGEILSHDFVEAALLRKAGWSVRMLPGIAGSWENSPPSLLDVAVRDRRWAQGNVQHLAVLPKPGLTASNRLHFVIGVMSYLASPLWLAMIAVGLWLSAQAAAVPPDYFPEPGALFPDWPSFDSERMVRLFLLTFALLLAPKAIGVGRVLLNGGLARRHGGRLRFVASALLELVVSTLYAPIMMMIQSRQLLEIALGRDSGWNLQSRRGGTTPWSTLVRRHAAHTALGVAVTLALVLHEPTLLPWMAPILIGLVLAVPLSRWSASERIGRALRRAGLLTTPEELAVPGEFRRREGLLGRYAALAAVDPHAVLLDPRARARHYRMTLAPPPRPPEDPDAHHLVAERKLERAESPGEGLRWLSPEELVAVLGDPALGRLLERRPRRREPARSVGADAFVEAAPRHEVAV